MTKFPTGWAVFGLTLALIIGFAVSIIGIYNYGNRAEKQIEAHYENMSNVLGQYSLKVSEAAQIPAIYRDDVTAVVTAAIEGRYGEGGSTAVLQFLREDNSAAKLDSAVYTKIQQIIEAGRNEYQNTQTRFIDVKRGYETALGTFWTGFWLKTFGYPRINLDDYKIVTSEHAQGALKSGVDTGLTIRK